VTTVSPGSDGELELDPLDDTTGRRIVFAAAQTAGDTDIDTMNADGSGILDQRQGTNASDVIVLLGGNDKASGKKGNDRICGGDGNDKIKGGPGKDHVTQ
jgi:Ca2+-binding RTX toxin-like protein